MTWILKIDELKLVLEKKKTCGVKTKYGVRKMNGVLKLVEGMMNDEYSSDVLFYVPNVFHLSLDLCYDPCHDHYRDLCRGLCHDPCRGPY